MYNKLRVTIRPVFFQESAEDIFLFKKLCKYCIRDKWEARKQERYS